MSVNKPLPRVAILTLPQCTASVVYGMYDLFRSAGRDWQMVVAGKPGPECVSVSLVAGSNEPFEIANGIRLSPHAMFDAGERYDDTKK